MCDQAARSGSPRGPAIRTAGLISVLLLFGAAILHGQAFSPQEAVRGPVRIDAVAVEGNKITSSDVILREIPFAFPAVLSDADLDLIRNRVQNLHLFNRVELRVDGRGPEAVLVVVVTESWYLWPSPVFFMSDQDWHKLSYGLELSDSNFRGRNEKLRVGGWLGYNPSYTLNYSVPWIGDRLRLMLGVGLFERRTQSRIFAFSEDRLGFNLRLGRRLSLEWETNVQFSLMRIKLPAEYASLTASGTGTDVVPALSWQLRWEHRDLVEYARSGAFLSVGIARTGFGRSQPNYWRANLDGRVYARLAGPVSIAVRQLFILDSGTMPVYDRVYLGFGERIRGYYTLVLPDPALYADYGRYQISLTSLELRIPILPIRYFSLKKIPLVPNLFRNLKFGLSAGIFFDGGFVWRSASELKLAKLYSGYGVGLHIHLPYINVLRLEYALNKQGRGEFMLGAGVSF